jgi:SagB-type dehydrogenase family enzyme
LNQQINQRVVNIRYQYRYKNDCKGQTSTNFAKKAAVVFAWSTIPYRSEWKYDISAHKKILIDVGHVCQNLYLASESVGAGACAIGIYDQKLIDEVLCLDGDEEFVLYLGAVGKKRK